MLDEGYVEMEGWKWLEMSPIDCTKYICKKKGITALTPAGEEDGEDKREAQEKTGDHSGPPAGTGAHGAGRGSRGGEGFIILGQKRLRRIW